MNMIRGGKGNRDFKVGGEIEGWVDWVELLVGGGGKCLVMKGNLMIWCGGGEEIMS